MKLTLLGATLLCFAAPAHAQAPRDPAHMSRADLAAEVNAQRPFITNGGVEPSRPSGCTAPEHRQLDFWLGEWDIYLTDAEMVVGEATVTPHDQGCAILEDFRPYSGAHGHGLFGYDARVGAWRQTYLDATGAYAVAQGNFGDGVMSFRILEPPPPPRFPADMDRQIRFQQIDANTVHQWGERMDPTEHAWVKFFDFTYRRRDPRPQ